MKILFLNRVYPPSGGATGELLAELAEALHTEGISVTVLTSGKVENERQEHERATIHVERVAGLPFTRSSHWKRALSYFSLYPAFLWRALRLPRQDVLVTLTDPPLHLLLGPVIRFFKGSHLVHWAQDIYPELAEELGVLPKNGVATRFLRRLSTWALRRHDIVVAVGRCMKERLVARGIASEKIFLIPNWAQEGNDQELPTPSFQFGAPGLAPHIPSSVHHFRSEHGMLGKFVVMYSGNFGLAHDFVGIAQAAQILEKTAPDILFVFAGEGPRLHTLCERVGGLQNVRFLPFQPKEKLQVSLQSADVHLASMKEELCGLVVPSKVYGILAAGRPCIFMGPEKSEVARLMIEQNCGWVLPPSCGARLAELIASLLRQPELLGEIGRRAEFVGKQFTAQSAAHHFQKFFPDS